MKKNVVNIIATLVIVAIAIGYGVFYTLSNKDEKKEEKKNVERKAKAVVKVETITAKEQDLIMYINTTGVAKAISEVTISPEVSGDVLKLHVHEGKKVNKNDVLFEIDNEEYDISLREAEVKLTSAKIDYGVRKKHDDLSITTQGDAAEVDKKLKKLKEDFLSGKLSAKEYENQKIELEVEKLLTASNKEEIFKNSSGLTASLLAYQRAKINYDNCVVKAPFSGYVAELDVVEGKHLTTGYNTMRLVDISTIKMEIPVLENEVGNIELGRNVDVVFDAYPGEVFKGQIKYISPVVNETTKTCDVTVIINNPSNKIKPGMQGNVTIEGKIFRDRLIVPKEAVIVRDNRKLLFIIEEGKAKWLYIKTGLDNFDFVEVTDKLEPGMEVVVTNNYTLAHDADVKVTKKDGVEVK